MKKQVQKRLLNALFDEEPECRDWWLSIDRETMDNIIMQIALNCVCMHAVLNHKESFIPKDKIGPIRDEVIKKYADADVEVFMCYKHLFTYDQFKLLVGAVYDSCGDLLFDETPIVIEVLRKLTFHCLYDLYYNQPND